VPIASPAFAKQPILCFCFGTRKRLFLSHEIWLLGVCAFELYHLQCFKGRTEVYKYPMELIMIIIIIIITRNVEMKKRARRPRRLVVLVGPKLLRLPNSSTETRRFAPLSQRISRRPKDLQRFNLFHSRLFKYYKHLLLYLLLLKQALELGIESIRGITWMSARDPNQRCKASAFS
jgi:hypothetical protein